MKKLLFTLLVLCVSQVSHAQLISGSLLESGRDVLGKPDFTIASKSSGTVVVELSVNRLGVVTGCKVIGEGTTIKSTPSVMNAQNASKKLKFTAGTRYAEFEMVRVKYTYTKVNQTVEG